MKKMAGTTPSSSSFQNYTCIVCSEPYERKKPVPVMTEEDDNVNVNETVVPPGPSTSSARTSSSSVKKDNFDKFKQGLELYWKLSKRGGTEAEMTETLLQSAIEIAGKTDYPCCDPCFANLVRLLTAQKIIDDAQSLQKWKVEVINTNLKRGTMKPTCLESDWIPLRSLLINKVGLPKNAGDPPVKVEQEQEMGTGDSSSLPAAGTHQSNQNQMDDTPTGTGSQQGHRQGHGAASTSSTDQTMKKTKTEAPPPPANSSSEQVERLAVVAGPSKPIRFLQISDSDDEDEEEDFKLEDSRSTITTSSNDLRRSGRVRTPSKPFETSQGKKSNKRPAAASSSKVDGGTPRKGRSRLVGDRCRCGPTKKSKPEPKPPTPLEKRITEVREGEVCFCDHCGVALRNVQFFMCTECVHEDDEYLGFDLCLPCHGKGTHGHPHQQFERVFHLEK